MFSPFRDIFANCEFPLRPLPPSGVAMTCRAAVGVAAKSWFNQAHATEPPPPPPPPAPPAPPPRTPPTTRSFLLSVYSLELGDLKSIFREGF